MEGRERRRVERPLLLWRVKGRTASLPEHTHVRFSHGHETQEARTHIPDTVWADRRVTETKRKFGASGMGNTPFTTLLSVSLSLERACRETVTALLFRDV